MRRALALVGGLLSGLAACGRGPEPWSEAAALFPVLTALDADGDGRVVAAEYERVAWRAPAFAQVDADGDGALGTAEVAALMDGQNPHTFDGTADRGAPDPELGPGMSGTMTPTQRHAWEVLHVLAAEATAAGVPAPTDAEIAVAVRGGLDGVEARALRARLQAAWAQAGMAFPAGLAP